MRKTDIRIKASRIQGVRREGVNIEPHGHAMRKIEQRSLNLAKWANLLMGAAGIIAAIGSHASALMLDGLFSGVNFLAAVMASRVAASIQKRPSPLRPFGYEIDEPMYVMFRSLVLTGVIIVAGFGAAGKIIDYVGGAEMAVIRLDWVLAYMIFMVSICAFMAFWHHRNWLKTRRKSDLLRTERRASMIDGILSAAAGAAFLLFSFLEGTVLSFLVPIADSIVVISLALIMIFQPIRAFVDAAKEVLGESAGPDIVETWRQAIHTALADTAFSLVEVAVTKLGRSQFAVAYIRPDVPASVESLDALREQVANACLYVHEPSRMEIIYTGNYPYG
jgi:predicted Co/Zn/Cd cation transporter (cation efflux family)